MKGPFRFWRAREDGLAALGASALCERLGSNLRFEPNKDSKRRRHPTRGCLLSFGAPERIRTSDPCLRRATQIDGVDRGVSKEVGQLPWKPRHS